MRVTLLLTVALSVVVVTSARPTDDAAVAEPVEAAAPETAAAAAAVEQDQIPQFTPFFETEQEAADAGFVIVNEVTGNEEAFSLQEEGQGFTDVDQREESKKYQKVEDVKTFNSEVHEYEYYPYEGYGKEVVVVEPIVGKTYGYHAATPHRAPEAGYQPLRTVSYLPLLFPAGDGVDDGQFEALEDYPVYPPFSREQGYVLVEEPDYLPPGLPAYSSQQIPVFIPPQDSSENSDAPQDSSEGSDAPQDSSEGSDALQDRSDVFVPRQRQLLLVAAGSGHGAGAERPGLGLRRSQPHYGQRLRGRVPPIDHQHVYNHGRIEERSDGETFRPNGYARRHGPAAPSLASRYVRDGNIPGYYVRCFHDAAGHPVVNLVPFGEQY